MSREPVSVAVSTGWAKGLLSPCLLVGPLGVATNVRRCLPSLRHGRMTNSGFPTAPLATGILTATLPSRATVRAANAWSQRTANINGSSTRISAVPSPVQSGSGRPAGQTSSVCAIPRPSTSNTAESASGTLSGTSIRRPYTPAHVISAGTRPPAGFLVLVCCNST